MAAILPALGLAASENVDCERDYPNIEHERSKAVKHGRSSNDPGGDIDI
jgi:hypothetical protein